MKFVVPQFIDVEDKVLGPLSVRQFVIILVGAGFIFILFKIMTFILAVLSAVFVMAFVFVFAFIKINGRGFHYFLLSLLETFRSPQLKVWRKDVERYAVKSEVKPKTTTKKYQPKTKQPLTSTRLTELTLTVDTGGVFEAKENEDEEEVIDEKLKPLDI